MIAQLTRGFGLVPLVTALMLVPTMAVMGDGDLSPFTLTMPRAEPGRLQIEDAFPISPSTPPVPRIAPLSSPLNDVGPPFLSGQDVRTTAAGTPDPADRNVCSTTIQQAVRHASSMTSDDGPSIVPAAHATGGTPAREESPSSAPVSTQSPSTSHITKASDVAQVERLAGLGNMADGATSPIEMLPRLLGITLFVLVTCGVTLWLVRRWLLRSGMSVRSSSSPRLCISATLPLPPHGRLHIVRVDDREYLAGTDARGLQQLLAITPSFQELLQGVAGDPLPSDQPQTVSVSRMSGSAFDHVTHGPTGT